MWLPQDGVVWKHPNLRVAYVAQHAFHHVELVRPPLPAWTAPRAPPCAGHPQPQACKHWRVAAPAAPADGEGGCVRARAQHLKSTPADYFWWRFKSGEDREGLEKVTRKITAAEAAQKDADIKAVSWTCQASIVRLGLGLQGGRPCCSYGRSQQHSAGLTWARAKVECAYRHAKSWSTMVAGLLGIDPPV